MTYPPNPYEQPEPSQYPSQEPSQPYGQYTYGQYPYPQYPQYPYGPARNQDNGLAVGAFVCSIVGLVACGGLLSVVGVVLGHVARGRIKRGEAGGDGLALASLIIGYIAIGLLVLFIGIIVVAGISTGWE
jgi:hypothetical protein